MAEKKENRGGAREGTGPKKKIKTISDKAKRRWVVAARKFAKENGITVEQAILNMIVDEKVQDSVKVGAAKLYSEAIIAKSSEQTITTQDTTPRIYLPEKREDPALRIVKGGK